jgi:Caspase domain
MRYLKWLAVGFGLLLASIWAVMAMTEKRVALIIGNSSYTYAGTLSNPANDASDMAASLKKLGFTVIEGYNLDKAAFEKKVRDFSKALSGADVGVFFYAGHGLQVAGANYLVPIDAELTTASALDFEMVRLDLVQRTMERETKTNILFLDACRNNPLSRNLARAMGTRGGDVGQGLAPAESGIGTLISFSTQPGNVAQDGVGQRNSPFTGPLVKRIATPGEDVLTILTDVRNDVLEATKEKQVPWENHALRAKFYFNTEKPASELKTALKLQTPIFPLIPKESERAVSSLSLTVKQHLDDNISQIENANSATGTINTEEVTDRIINAINKSFADLVDVKFKHGQFFDELDKCTEEEKDILYHFFVHQLIYLMVNSNFDHGNYEDFNKGIYEQSYYLQNDHARKLIASRLGTEDYTRIAVALLSNVYRNDDI